jgi:hypothetical protein
MTRQRECIGLSVKLDDDAERCRCGSTPIVLRGRVAKVTMDVLFTKHRNEFWDSRESRAAPTPGNGHSRQYICVGVLGHRI